MKEASKRIFLRRNVLRRIGWRRLRGDAAGNDDLLGRVHAIHRIAHPDTRCSSQWPVIHHHLGQEDFWCDRTTETPLYGNASREEPCHLPATRIQAQHEYAFALSRSKSIEPFPQSAPPNMSAWPTGGGAGLTFRGSAAVHRMAFEPDPDVAEDLEKRFRSRRFWDRWMVPHLVYNFDFFSLLVAINDITHTPLSTEAQADSAHLLQFATRREREREREGGRERWRKKFLSGLVWFGLVWFGFAVVSHPIFAVTSPNNSRLEY